MREITRLRLARGWSKNQLAQKARITPADVGRIESGRLIPYEPQLRKLARALGVPRNDAQRLLQEASNPGDESNDGSS